jgi:translation initiation factor IF-2
VAKVRVYELAKELGVESKLILTLLKDWGLFIRSASSEVDSTAERRLRERLGRVPRGRALTQQPPRGGIHRDVLAPWPTSSRRPETFHSKDRW